jgi:hypothetical protein
MMTNNDFYNLRLDKRYIFITYTNKKYYGVMTMRDDNFYIVENENIMNFSEALNKNDKEVLKQIMKPIKLEIVDEWSEQK